MSCWMQTYITSNYHALFFAHPTSDRLKKAIKVDECFKAKLLPSYFHRDIVSGNPKLTPGMPMHHSTMRWYTCITFPYRLLVHHFHFDIAGDVELINIDCEKSGEQRDLVDMCRYVMVERERGDWANRSIISTLWRLQLHISWCASDSLPQTSWQTSGRGLSVFRCKMP